MVVFLLSVLEEGLEGLVGAEDLVAVRVRAVRTGGRVLEQHPARTARRPLLQAGRRLRQAARPESALGSGRVGSGRVGSAKVVSGHVQARSGGECSEHVKYRGYCITCIGARHTNRTGLHCIKTQPVQPAP